MAGGGGGGVGIPGACPAERAEAVARALSRVGEHRYSLLGNNCEHFASWCATGAAVSRQVAGAAHMLLGWLRAALVAFLGVLVVRLATAAG